MQSHCHQLESNRHQYITQFSHLGVKIHPEVYHAELEWKINKIETNFNDIIR